MSHNCQQGDGRRWFLRGRQHSRVSRETNRSLSAHTPVTRAVLFAAGSIPDARSQWVLPQMVVAGRGAGAGRREGGRRSHRTLSRDASAGGRGAGAARPGRAFSLGSPVPRGLQLVLGRARPRAGTRRLPREAGHSTTVSTRRAEGSPRVPPFSSPSAPEAVSAGRAHPHFIDEETKAQRSAPCPQWLTADSSPDLADSLLLCFCSRARIRIWCLLVPETCVDPPARNTVPPSSPLPALCSAHGIHMYT